MAGNTGETNVRHDSHANRRAALPCLLPTRTHVAAPSLRPPLLRQCLRQRLRQRLWLTALCAVALVGAAAYPPARSQGQAQVNLPALGDTESEDFGIGTERKLGDQVMREIRRDPDYLDDPVLLDYIESLWVPLLTQARSNGNITAE